MILGHHDEENKCGATIITAMDIPVTYVGKFMANLQIGFPKDKLKDMHVKLNQTKTMKQQQKIKPQFCLARNRLSNSCRLLNQSPAPSSSTPSLGLCYVAQSGNYHSALKSTIHFKEPWIIDSGASDHMAGVSNFFPLLYSMS